MSELQVPIPEAAYQAAYLMSSPGGMTEAEARRMIDAAARHIQAATLQWYAKSAGAMADIANLEGRLPDARRWRDVQGHVTDQARRVVRTSQGGGSRVS
ncbi:hypothetical protein N8J89_07880 [Crossiella sp. CA-258035]|uniref:hypothetical protein n=1 Tax=Crossiella sp. CA-258035 TaxID=2981138 RepID=UPI0024BC2541|nr:hypothetical protein [Crossiella sp. CA-258035]WHT20973.1 hypothetical protein N8J89_07880 [Crossiella sp. CA-258035]